MTSFTRSYTCSALKTTAHHSINTLVIEISGLDLIDDTSEDLGRHASDDNSGSWYGDDEEDSIVLAKMRIDNDYSDDCGEEDSLILSLARVYDRRIATQIFNFNEEKYGGEKKSGITETKQLDTEERINQFSPPKDSGRTGTLRLTGMPKLPSRGFPRAVQMQLQRPR